MKQRAWSLALAALLVAAANAGVRTDYAYQWPLQFAGASGAYRLALTPEVYAELQGTDLRDLEVFNAGGDAVPFGPLPPSVATGGAAPGDFQFGDWQYAAAASTGAGSGREFTYRSYGPLPIERVRVDLGNDNALAELSILVRNPGQGWRLVAGLTAYSLAVENTTLERNSVGIAVTREREWLLRSAQPLPSAPQLQLGFRPDQFLVLAQGAAPYSLLAGSRSARRADYPTAQLLKTLRSELGSDWRPPPATLGLGSKVRVVDPSGAAPAPNKSHKAWALWIVLLLGAALVVGMVFKLLREKPPTA